MPEATKTFIELARAAGMEKIRLHALVQNRDEILLLEQAGIYEGAEGEVFEGESITQAMQRIIMERAALNLLEVKQYLGHQDEEKTRELFFVVNVDEPSTVQGTHAWVRPEDADGYHITDKLKEIIVLLVTGT